MSSELNQIASWSLRWRIALSGTLCLVAALCAAQPNDANAELQAEQRFQMALEAQSDRDYRTMLDMLRQAANEGHAQAQEMLGMVLLTGPTLYAPPYRPIAARRARGCIARRRRAARVRGRNWCF
nr:sel1 repeat family protein [Variovorax sp. E3]